MEVSPKKRIQSGELLVPPLTDPDRLAAYENALANWAVTGYIQFSLSQRAGLWIANVLGVKEREIKRLMYEFVSSGGEIDEVKETRDEWKEHEFHHDLRIPINKKSVYIETRLIYKYPVVPDESWIQVVNIHEQ